MLQNTLPFDLQNQVDIGPHDLPGSTVYDSDQQLITLTSPAGTGFHFLWRRLSGDFILTARVILSEATRSPDFQCGWMARSTLESHSAQVCAALFGDGRSSLVVRRTATTGSEPTAIAVKNADVIQLERRGTTYWMSVARFGDPFTTVETIDVNLGAEVYVGLFVSAGHGDAAVEAIFQNVRVVVPVAPGFDREHDPFGSRLEVLDIHSGHRRILHSADQVFEAPNWTRDGQALIFNQTGRIYRFDLESHAIGLIDTGDIRRNNNDHVISFDGTTLAISHHAPPDYHSRIYTVALTGGQPRLVTPLGPSYLHGWSPDGQFLVYTALRDGDYDIYRIPAAGGAEVRLTTAPGLDDGPEYTPDGEYIYFNSVRSGRMQIWRMKPDGSAQEPLTDDAYNNWFPHISPDGQWVVFLTYLVGEVEPSDHPAAKRVYLRRMPLNGGTPQVIAYLYGGQGSLNVPSWSPDSRQIALVSNTVPV